MVFSVRLGWYSNTPTQGGGVGAFVEGGLASPTMLIAESNQPRLALLWRRLQWARTNSLTCSLCGPGSYAYWSCTHCHISLCPRCYVSATLPDEAALDLPTHNQRLLPSPSDCRSFPLPALRGPLGVSSVPVAGSASDRSVVLDPFVWVTVGGLDGAHRVVAPQGDGRTSLLLHGHGVHRFVVDCPALKPAPDAEHPLLVALDERVGAVCDLVAATPVSRLVIDLRCHATPQGYSFGRVALRVSGLIERVIRPLLEAHLERLPNAAALSPLPLARTVLVVLHCCDVSGTSFQQLFSELRRSNPLFVFEFLTFGRPLLLGDISLVLPQILPAWANLLCRASFPEMLSSVLSDSFVRAYLPQMLLPAVDGDGFALLPLRPAVPVDPLQPSSSLSVAFPSAAPGPPAVGSVFASSVASPPPASSVASSKRARVASPSPSSASCDAAADAPPPFPPAGALSAFCPSFASWSASSLPFAFPGGGFPFFPVGVASAPSAAALAVPDVTSSSVYIHDQTRSSLLLGYLHQLSPVGLAAVRALPMPALLAHLNSVLPSLHFQRASRSAAPRRSGPAAVDPASLVTEVWLRSSRRLWSLVSSSVPLAALPPAAPLASASASASVVLDSAPVDVDEE